MYCTHEAKAKARRTHAAAGGGGARRGVGTRVAASAALRRGGVAHSGFEISVSRTHSEEDSVSIWYKLRAVCMYVC